MKQASVSGGITVSYNYDGLGRRVQRTSTTSGTTRFIYDGPDVLRDVDSNLNTVAEYLNAPPVDNKLRQIDPVTTSYFLTDHLGSSRSTVSSAGDLSSSVTYDAFGNLITGSVSTRYTYTGREVDSDIGYIYYRARWYDSLQSRFLTEDPIQFVGGDTNLYRYVRSNAMRYYDPFGTQRRSDRGWDEGEEDPITHKTLHNDYKQAAGMACALNGVNPWIFLEGNAGFQFLNFAGASGGGGMMINLFTMEVCFYVRGGWSPGMAIGLYGGASGQVGFAFGPAEGKNAGGYGLEGFVDAAEGAGVSGKAFGVSKNSVGVGASAGPTVGGGWAFGLRSTWTKILYCLNSPDCSCQK